MNSYTNYLEINLVNKLNDVYNENYKISIKETNEVKAI